MVFMYMFTLNVELFGSPNTNTFDLRYHYLAS